MPRAAGQVAYRFSGYFSRQSVPPVSGADAHDREWMEEETCTEVEHRTSGARVCTIRAIAESIP